MESVSSPRGGKRGVLSAAVLAGLLAAAIVGFAAAGESSTPTGETTTSTAAAADTPTTVAPSTAMVDVAEFLPPFHEELNRLTAPRPDGPPALLVASSPRQDPPRPVTITLIEWDRAGYRQADRLDLDCGFVEKLLVDEDQAMFLGCNLGGATARSYVALLPDRLKIAALPSGDSPGWGNSFETIPRAGQPDDLQLLGRRYLDGGGAVFDVYSLVWDPTFRQWNLVECVPQDGSALRYDPPMNGTVGDITYEGCPSPMNPLGDPSPSTGLFGE